MSDRIPEDVMAAAMRSLMVPEHEMVESVSRAILAERERCAKIADPIVTNRKGKLSTDMRTPADIATAIRQ